MSTTGRGTRRGGRRPGSPDTRGQILDAARRLFAEQGYEATSLRAVARAAEVDPALIHHYFDGGKPAVFAASLAVPADLLVRVEEVLADGPDGLGERFLRFFLGLWEDPATADRLRALVRSVLGSEQTAEQFRGFLGGEVVVRVAAATGRPDGALRAEAAASQAVGLAVLRYLLQIPPLADEPLDAVVTRFAPVIQHHLTGDGPFPSV